MMLNYATPDDVTVPEDMKEEDIRMLIAHASRLMRNETKSAIYHTDKAGAPSHPYIRAAFHEATVVQVQHWVATQAYKTILGHPTDAPTPRVASTSENGASITFDYGEVDAHHSTMNDTGISPVAASILDDAGLRSTQPRVAYYPWAEAF